MTNYNSDSNDIARRVDLGLSKIRPYLQADGGDVHLVELTDDLVVKIQFTGACVTCPMSMQTFKAGVEQTLRNMVPELKEIVNLTSEDLS